MFVLNISEILNMDFSVKLGWFQILLLLYNLEQITNLSVSFLSYKMKMILVPAYSIL